VPEVHIELLEHSLSASLRRHIEGVNPHNLSIPPVAPLSDSKQTAHRFLINFRNIVFAFERIEKSGTNAEVQDICFKRKIFSFFSQPELEVDDQVKIVNDGWTDDGHRVLLT